MKPPERLLPRGTVLALIDSDMIVTGPLAEVGRLAGEGKIFAYPDHHSALERRFLEWEELFELGAPLRRQTYVNAGLVVFSTGHWPDLVGRWSRACALIPPERILD